MKPVRVLVFDFDGVIVESASIKDDLMREMFRGYPRQSEKIDFYLQTHAGLSRYEKIDYILEHILEQNAGEDEKRKMYKVFSVVAMKAVARCPYVAGAIDYLKKCKGVLPLYLVSATPQDEIRSIAADRGVGDHFQGIYGSPMGKSEHLTSILDSCGCEPDEVLYIGDSFHDYEAARKANVRFVGRVYNDDSDVFKGCGVDAIVKDLSEMDGLGIVFANRRN